MLNIVDNNITDNAIDAIITAMKKNSCLVRLYMYGNPLTGEAIVNMVNGLRVNDTIAVIGLPKCSEEIKKRITSLQEVINEKRISQGSQVKLIVDYP